ncbi:MAG: POTRA domain-containing protein, partial [Bacteroidia bacterium]
MPKYFYLFLIGLCFTVGKAQEVRLNIIFPSSDKWIKNIGYKQKLNTKEAAYKEINSVIFTLQQKGYLLAAIDTLYNDTSSVTAVISENKPFKWAYLKLGNLNPSLASKLGISEKLYFNKAFRYNEMAKSINKIITWYENNGYPFASVKLDSVETNEDQVKAVLNVEKNKFFKIDSVKIQGNARINKKFLYRYLSIKESMPYNEVAIASISQKIKQLPFVFEKQPQIVRLTNKTNKLVLFLDKKNASQFDGIIG